MSYDTNNIFAKILRGEIPCKKVYEDDYALAFHDIAPKAPVHVLVIPKTEAVSFADFSQMEARIVAGYFAAVGKVASQLGLVEGGYRLISNAGRDANQEVPHFHTHILAGRNLGGLL